MTFDMIATAVHAAVCNDMPLAFRCMKITGHLASQHINTYVRTFGQVDVSPLPQRLGGGGEAALPVKWGLVYLQGRGQ